MFGVDMAKPGAQAYYDSLAELYASWGVDYIKADDMAMPYDRMEEVRALSRALVRAGRPVVLSLSPGPAHPLLAQDLRRYAHLWRVTADFWDDWKSLRGSFRPGPALDAAHRDPRAGPTWTCCRWDGSACGPRWANRAGPA